MPTTPDPQPSDSAGAPAQTSGASSLDYGAIEQRVITRYCLQEYSAVDAQHVELTTLSDLPIYQGTSTGRVYMHQQEVLRCLLEQNPPRRNPWPLDTQANLELTQEDFIMANYNDTFIVNRITHVNLEAHLDHLLAHYSEGTTRGDELKALFEVHGSVSMRDEDTAAQFQERCYFLAACYASRSFPPKRDTLKTHVLNMLTTATRDVLGAYGVVAEAASGNRYAVLNTGRAAVFNELERVVRDRVGLTNDANPGSLCFYRDAPPKDWVDAEKTAGFVHDKKAHDDELKLERSLIETLDVSEDIKKLMRAYLARAGNNYANALRYYHTVSVLSLFRNHADNYTALLFYSYEVNGTEVRGLQYGVDASDYIEGFGCR